MTEREMDEGHPALQWLEARQAAQDRQIDARIWRWCLRLGIGIPVVFVSLKAIYVYVTVTNK